MSERGLYFFIIEKRGFNYTAGGSCTESLIGEMLMWVQKQHQIKLICDPT